MLLKMSASVFSEKGIKRKINQDNYYLNGKICEDVNNKFTQRSLYAKEGVFAVCDGIGKGTAAATASGIVVDEFKKNESAGRTNERVIKRIVDKSNERICEHISESGENVGASFVSVVINSQGADIYNIGNSRCYLIRKGNVRRLTKDHTLAASMAEAGKISKEEAEKDKRRYELVQHLGISPDEITLSIFQKSIELKKNDVLLLCTDGITEGLDDKKIVEIVEENEDVRSAAVELTESAINNGSTDNATAMVIRMQNDPEEHLIRMLYAIICICSGILGAVAAIISLILF